MLEGLEEHRLVHLRRQIDDKNLLAFGPLDLAHL